MSTIDRTPTSLSRWLAVGAGLLALVASGFYSWAALTLASLGLGLLGLGLARGSNRALTGGAAGQFAGAILAGAQGAPVLPVLGAVVLVVLAWDVGSFGIGVGNQLGRAAETRRIELVHAAGSAGVGSLVVIGGYGVYRLGSGGQPVAALFFLLVGAVVLFGALR